MGSSRERASAGRDRAQRRVPAGGRARPGRRLSPALRRLPARCLAPSVASIVLSLAPPAGGLRAGAGLAFAASGRGGVPLETRLPILLKALTYDRRFRERAGEEFLVLGVYLSGSRESEEAAGDLLASFGALAGKTIVGVPLRARLLAWRDERTFTDSIAAAGPGALYIAEGCEAILPVVLRIAGEHRVLTMAAYPETVERGASLAVGERDGRPEIVVNLETSRREGSQFSSDLLKLCRVIR